MLGAAICEGSAYEWAGKVYRSEGAYTRSFPSSHGCDSIVQFTLTVLEVPLPVLMDTFIFENTTLEFNTGNLWNRKKEPKRLTLC